MKNLVIYFFLCLFIFEGNSQKKEESEKLFDSIYYQTAVNLVTSNPSKAIEVADSLYIHSLSEIHKVRSLMLKANIYHQLSKRKTAVTIAKQAEQIASQNDLYEWQARISGFLSTQYRSLGLLNEGKEYLEIGLRASKRIPDAYNRDLFTALAYQESAYYALDENKFKEALLAVNKAKPHFENLTENAHKSYYIATNEELYGRCYLKLNNIEKAQQHYILALEFAKKSSQEESVLHGFIYSGLGQVYLNKELPDSAFPYLEKASQIAKTSDFKNLKLETELHLANYYKFIGDLDNYSAHNTMYLKYFDEEVKATSASVDTFMSNLQNEKKALNTKQTIILIGSILLLFGFIIGMILYRKKKKKELANFKRIIKDLKSVATKEPQTVLNPKKEIAVVPKEKVNMSKGVEEKILQSLSKFEQSKKFTDKNMSLSVLAGLLDTNTKYLSSILNQHLNKDFNTYINELRIQYIIRHMQENTAYQNYKISYLAEESGFSSHSKFTAVFKSVTGLTPSVFLNLLENSTDEDDDSDVAAE